MEDEGGKGKTELVIFFESGNSVRPAEISFCCCCVASFFSVKQEHGLFLGKIKDHTPGNTNSS
jgi:hypothetical protein